MEAGEQFILEAARLGELLSALAHQGYEVIGPSIRDGAIVYEPVHTVDDLPRGWTDEQGPGYYRLRRRDDDALFGFNVGPHSWKKFLYPASHRLFTATCQQNGTQGAFRIVEEVPSRQPRYAFLGVRACELHAIAILDKVLASPNYTDPDYKRLRESTFLVAVNCTQAGATCFCASMGTGPGADSGYDLVLTELLEGSHRFVVRAGSSRGADVLAALTTRVASAEERELASSQLDHAAAHMGRQLDTGGLQALLYRSYDHPHWEAIAQRCLSCANCTLVCPTCFCTTIEDVTDLSGDHAERWRRWDSCFTTAFSYLHGGSVRSSTKARYRQWMVHKLAAWIDQFDESGCVGCGRCIAWCPAGIDITAEARALREAQAAGAHAP